MTVEVESNNDDVTMDDDTLEFTTSTWVTAQTVRVSTAEDTDRVNDAAALTHRVRGVDYAVVGVTVTDNDAVPTSVSLSVNPATVAENARATAVAVTATLNSGAFTIPTAVTVSVGAAGDGATEGGGRINPQRLRSSSC